MPCFHPLKAFRGRETGPSGKVRIVFKKEDSCGVELELPCGRCIGCRLERSRQWAVRCMHEAAMYDDNCFITLTYDDAHLPVSGSLDKREMQLFFKRMRERVGPFRYFHCGEYGDSLSRPHYHACIFGFDFPDKELFREKADTRLFTSPLLDSLWSRGFCTVGNLTFESAAYVARYVTKKVTGDNADEHYCRLCEDGVVRQLQPEYVTMSRRPGIGSTWFERWGNEVYPSDEVIVRGFQSKPPRFYDKLFEAAEPSVFDSVTRERRKRARERAHDGTPDRLLVREKVAKARLRSLRRELEE